MCSDALQGTHVVLNWNSKEVVPVKTVGSFIKIHWCLFLCNLDIMSLTPIPHNQITSFNKV